MPSYDYEVVDEAGTVLTTLTLVRSVEGRDSVTLRRRTVPDSIIFAGTAPDNPFDHQKVSMRYLAKKEDRMGGPEFRRRMGMSASKAADIWKRPEPKETPTHV